MIARLVIHGGIVLLARGAVSLTVVLPSKSVLVVLLGLVLGVVPSVGRLVLVVPVVWVPVVRVLVDGAQGGGEHLPVLFLVALPQLVLA